MRAEVEPTQVAATVYDQFGNPIITPLLVDRFGNRVTDLNTNGFIEWRNSSVIEVVRW